MSPPSLTVRPEAWSDSTRAIPARICQRIPWQAGTCALIWEAPVR